MSKKIIPIHLVYLLMFLLLTLSVPANAYIGPGAGISVVGSLLGILATIFVAIGAIVFWPLRKWQKRRKARRESLAANSAAGSQSDASREDSQVK